MLSDRGTLLNWGWFVRGCFVLTTGESLKLSKLRKGRDGDGQTENTPSWEGGTRCCWVEGQAASQQCCCCFWSWVAQPERNGTLHFNGLTVVVWPMLRFKLRKHERLSRELHRLNLSNRKVWQLSMFCFHATRWRWKHFIPSK